MLSPWYESAQAEALLGDFVNLLLRFQPPTPLGGQRFGPPPPNLAPPQVEGACREQSEAESRPSPICIVPTLWGFWGMAAHTQVSLSFPH